MLDISFDFETCALCPNAAVMSVGAVVWNRSHPTTPFFKDRKSTRLNSSHSSQSRMPSSA